MTANLTVHQLRKACSNTANHSTRAQWAKAEGLPSQLSHWNREICESFLSAHGGIPTAAPAPTAPTASAPSAPAPTAPSAPAPSKYLRRAGIDDVIEKYLDKGKPVALYGETGTGKTQALRAYAERRGLDCLVISVSRDVTVRELISKVELRDGDTVREPNAFTLALQSPSVVVLDELNHVPAALLSTLHELLQERQLHSPDLGLIRVHPDCKIGATLNPAGAVYSGTNSLNPALVERFGLALEVRHFTATEIRRVTGLDEDSCDFLAKSAKALVTAKSKAAFGIRSCINFKDDLDDFGAKTAVKHFLARLNLTDARAGQALKALTDHYFDTLTARDAKK